MEEESLTPQVLSSAISSICAVISNYRSLIEVHVGRSPPSPSLHRWIPATHLLHKVTLPEIQRVISIILFSLTCSSPRTPSLSSRKQLAPFDVWLDSRWVTFTAASDSVSIQPLLRTLKSVSIWHHAPNIHLGLPVLLPCSWKVRWALGVPSYSLTVGSAGDSFLSSYRNGKNGYLQVTNRLCAFNIYSISCKLLPYYLVKN